VSHGTRVPDRGRLPLFRLQDDHLLWSTFPGDSAREQLCNSPTLAALGSSRAPRHRSRNACGLVSASRFRLFPVRSPLLRKSRFLSVPGGTEMFQFSPLASSELCIHSEDGTVFPYRVSPFGDLRVKACVQLPEAYRSLPRPSSPIDAKASTIRP
jgi:hypothetical protein